MSQDKNNSSAERHNDSDQIDLIDLMVQVWKGKITIIVCVMVTVFIATFYLFVAKEKWTSTALITRPDSSQVSSLSHAMDILYGGNAPSINTLQQDLITRFNSSFSALSETLDNQEEPEKLTIDVAVKGQGLPLRVSYSGPSAEEARQTLAKYIQQVDDEVAEAVEGDLNANILSRKSELEQSISTLKNVATERKELRIAQITQALTVAQQSKITVPFVQQAEQLSQDNMFLLGSNALGSMIKNEATRPLDLPDSYFGMRNALLEINFLTNGGKNGKPKDVNAHAYRYVMKPTLPIRRDSPKRTITLILAILLGGILGSGIVLGRNALRNYQPKM